MSPARETSALTFGAAAAGTAGAISWFALAPSGLWAFVPMVAVGAVAMALGAAVGEWIAASGWFVASVLGAGVLVVTEGVVLGALFAADTVQRFSLNRPPHWGELLNPRTWAVVIGFAIVLAVVGIAAGLIARRWAQSVTDA